MSSYGRTIDETAALIGLAIAPAHKPGVEQNLAVMARMAALVSEFQLDDGSDEPATVFVPR